MNLQHTIAYLCDAAHANFYAYVYNSFERTYERGSGRFYVTPRGNRYLLSIDPDWAAQMEHRELLATLEHEVLHVILNHVPRGYELFQLCDSYAARRQYLALYNIAADMAVNEILRRNHPWIVDLDYIILPEHYGLPPRKAFEEYLALLLGSSTMSAEKVESALREALQGLERLLHMAPPGSMGAVLNSPNPEHADSDETTEGADDDDDDDDDASLPYNRLAGDIKRGLESHIGYLLQDLSDEGLPTDLKEYGQSVIRKTVKTFTKNYGTLPAGIEELVQSYLRPPTTPWNTIFRSHVQRAQKSRPIRGFTKISMLRAAMQIQLKRQGAAFARRLPLVPGTTRDARFRVVVAIDTSGSMSYQDISEGLTELRHIQKAAPDMEICVLYVDAGIAKEYTIGPNDPIDYQIAGRGGTSCDPVFQHINEQKKHVDLLVYITDAEMAPPRYRIAAPTIWLITPGATPVTTEAGHISIEMRPY